MEPEQHPALLAAYADGELELAQLVAVEAHLQNCPACRARVENIRAGRALLKSTLPRYSAPASVERKILAALPAVETAVPRPARNILPFIGWVSSLAAALVVGLFIGLQHGGNSAVLDEALASHERSLMAAHLFDVVSTDQHTVKPWFAGKINFAPPVVDLTEQGYPLAGGRLDQLGAQPAAALVYARGKHFINLFVWPAGSSPLPEGQTSSRGYQSILWSANGLNFLAVSEIPAADLAAFAQAYRAQVH